MNICLVQPTRKVRVGLRGLCRHLVSRGHRVIVLTPAALEKADLAYFDSVPVLVYPSVFLPRVRYTIPNFLRQLSILRETVRKEKIDIVHIWEYFYPTAWLPWLCGKVWHIPVIITTDAFPGISWRYGSGFVDIMARLYSKSIGKLILRSSDRVLLLHSHLTATARELGLKQENTLVLPNGVEAAVTVSEREKAEIRKSLGIKPAEKMILNVGRLVPVKGIDMLIKITDRLLDDGLEVKMVIVGDGPYQEEYENKAKKWQENIIFTGFRRDILQLMSACDLFLLPSLSEGLPNVLLEAAACGKPVVASNVGGIPDIVTHQETGFLAPPEDVDAFVHYIKIILSDGNPVKMGQAARRAVEERFNWETIINKLEEIYQTVLAEKG